jgi:hypothetical protein
MYRLWVLLPVAALLLSGCPKKGDQTSVQVNEINVPASPVETPAQPAEESAPSGSSEAEGSAASNETVTAGARTPSKEELAGRWFALYGGVGAASGRYTYEDGHQIEFLENGSAMWIPSGGAELASTWTMSGDAIVVNVTNPAGLDNATFKSTPLAFGRDDEVGLTSSTPGQGAPKLLFRFKPQLDNGFLALVGRNNELMVYGRVGNQAPDSAPDVSGKWQLVPAAGQTFDAEVVSADSIMRASWGPYHSKFEGRYTHGYWVGMVSSSGGNAYAAVTPASNGGLDGVISTEPYTEMATTFDFTRAN